MWFDRTGREVGTVGGLDAGSLQYPSLSKGGRRLASDRTVLGNRDLSTWPTLAQMALPLD